MAGIYVPGFEWSSFLNGFLLDESFEMSGILSRVPRMPEGLQFGSIFR